MLLIIWYAYARVKLTVADDMKRAASLECCQGLDCFFFFPDKFVPFLVPFYNMTAATTTTTTKEHIAIHLCLLLTHRWSSFLGSLKVL